MPVIDHGRVVALVQQDVPKTTIPHANNTKHSIRPRYVLNYGHSQKATIAANSKDGQQLLANLTLIRERFGCSISMALRLAVNILANAIREGRLP